MKTQSRRLSFIGFLDYKVKTNGTVWSKRKSNATGHNNKWRQLKQGVTRDHHHVTLFNKNGRKIFFVHHLVLWAFVGPCPPGKECCHYPDRDPSNNDVTNLSWGSKKRNQRHRIKHGTDSGGERNGNAVLTWKKVRKIRRLRKRNRKKWTQPRLMRKFRIGRTTLQSVLYHRTWIEK